MARRPSERIAVIRHHVQRCMRVDSASAALVALEIYLDEVAGFKIPDNHPIRHAEVAMGVLPLLPEDP